MTRIEISTTDEGNKFANLVGVDVDDVRICREDGGWYADDYDGTTGEIFWASKPEVAARAWAKALGYKVSPANTKNLKRERGSRW